MVIINSGTFRVHEIVPPTLHLPRYMHYEVGRIQKLLMNMYILHVLAVFRSDNDVIRFNPFPSVAVSLRQHFSKDE
jgi:hypothetical protein